ncbi:ACP S-malonyltransferase [bacterium endosymbiont of Pedicinus badii]|uniref:ACP S-malonyltransferase n=1 Tax=bacterium endosymbiont of Pedicinus badii TaxID=1719126 RepID=UPI0009BA0BC1|nr:ACP S-malonyltransferase [bacterium endosymbiont of Pedicinus badii]OQM34362.1 hypothetical protein AOQ89_00510 [bacterium endosymbiont of Pedicinus badii]
MGICTDSFLKKKNRKFAFVFPGQGSQEVGMLSQLYSSYQIVKRIFLESSEILGYDLWGIIKNNTKNSLHTSSIIQPAILTCSYAIWKVWKYFCNLNPSYMMGHSLGEYSALVCSESIDFSTAIKLVRFRGKIMQDFSKKIGFSMFAVIGKNCQRIMNLYKDYLNSKNIYLTNFNSYDQVVICGKEKSICILEEKKIFENFKFFKIPMNVLSHCKVMKSTSTKLFRFLKKINFCKPKIPIVSSINKNKIIKKEEIKKYLTQQMYKSINWMNMINYLKKRKIKKIFEIGPKNILTRITKNYLDKDSLIMPINSKDSLLKAIMKIKEN